MISIQVWPFYLKKWGNSHQLSQSILLRILLDSPLVRSCMHVVHTSPTQTRMLVVLHGCTSMSSLCPHTCSPAAILDTSLAGSDIQALQDSCQRLTKSVVDCLLRNHIAFSVSGWDNFLSDPFKGIFSILDSSQALKE